MDLDTEPKVSEETDVTSEEIVLVSNAVPIPGTCRRKDRFADQGKYEMSWLLTSKLIAGNYQYEQTDLPDIEAVFGLVCSKSTPNQLTCKLIDGGDVIKDYLQANNLLAIDAKLSVQALLDETVIHFKEFAFKKEKGSYYFESMPLEVGDRFAIEFLASKSQKIKVTVHASNAGQPSSSSSLSCGLEPITLTDNHTYYDVFRIQLLLDKIIGYVVHDEDLGRCQRPKDVVGVCRAWRESVCRVMKSKHADYLTPHSIGQKLQQIPGGFPLRGAMPYNLVFVEGHSITPQTSKFMRAYPPIGMRYVSYGTFDETLFKLLKSFALEALEISIQEESITLDDIQKLLDPYKDLKQLTITGEIEESSTRKQLVLPKKLHNLTLRTKLGLINPLDCNENNLCKLKLFDVRVNQSVNAVANGVAPPDVQKQLSVSLNKLIKSMRLLEYLNIEVEEFREVRIVIPDLPNLKKLYFLGTEFTTQAEFQELEHLCLQEITLECFTGMFIQDRPFRKVSKFALGCSRLSADAIDRMADCLPNCLNLAIRIVVNTDSASIFSRLFARMKLLNSLRLSLVVEDAAFFTTERLISYLTGLSTDEVRRLQSQQNEWDSYQLGSTAICNLNGLQKLELEVKWPESGQFVRMTDLFFQLTFLRMPLLNDINLESGVRVPDDVQQNWINQGGLYVNHDIEQESDHDDNEHSDRS